MNVVVVIPTYNEKHNIGRLLERLARVLGSIRSITYAVVVVDDTSPDGTGDEVLLFQKKHNRRVHLLSGKKEGLGHALMRGAMFASEELKADVIIQMDADLSHDPLSIPQFIKAIQNGADFVVGCRYIRGGSIPKNWGIHRKIYSRFGNMIVRYGLGYLSIHDWTGGFRAYKQEYFLKIRPKVERFSGYVFQIAVLHNAVLLGATIREVPIHFQDRTAGKSKIVFSEYILDIFRYIYRARMRQIRHGPFGKFLVVGSIGFIINTIGLEGFVAMGLHPSIAASLGAECAIISNFILNNSWTFSHKKISGKRLFGKFIQFNIMSVGAIIIQFSTIFVGSLLWGVTLYRLYYIIGVGIGLVWNYTMYSKVIWKK